MTHLKFWTITSTILVVSLFAGCNEEQKSKLDVAATQAEQITAGIRQVGDSPIGQLIPEEIKLWGLLAVILVEAAANGWQAWRSSNMKAATKAIVKGIEAAQAASESPNPNPVIAIKSAIEDEMKAAGIYDSANKIVDSLKLSR